MKIKVCGMKDPGNIREVSELKPDLMGFIFYPSSPRNAFETPSVSVRNLPEEIQAVGVFVNSSFADIIDTAYKYGINIVQLHGNEPPETCRQLQQAGLKVIKAVNIKGNESKDYFSSLENYIGVIDCFLFDTGGKNPGGNGEKFNWGILESYPLDIPFFLSGGIGPEDADLLSSGIHKKCVGIDLNSRFEISPGIKNKDLLKDFFIKTRNEPSGKTF